MANQELRAKLLAARNDPHAQQFLDFIAHSEGVKHGYNTLFGNKQFDSLDDHPRIRQTYTYKGKRHTSSAAGRYQFMPVTWDEIVSKLGSQNFSAEEQDLGALYLLHKKGALDDVLAGNPQAAIQKLGSTWASLSSSKYDQPKRTAESEQAWFDKNPVAKAEGVAEFVASLLPKPLDSVAGGIGAAVEAVRAVRANPERSLFEESEALRAARDTTVLNSRQLPQEAEAVIEEELANAARLEMQMRQNELRLQEESLRAREQQEAPSIWQKLKDSLGDARARERIEIEDSPAWEQQLMSSALDADAEAISHNAVSRFLGEPEATRIRLPKGIEEAIEQALRSV